MTGADLDAALFRFERNTVVQASAGTGKTETLTTLYTCCLAGAVALPGDRAGFGVAPERILAITFTEKAAGEMAARVRQAVRDLAAGRRSGLLPERLSAQVARIQAERPGWSAPDAAGWSEIARRLTGATITTFHGFAGSLLRRHPVAAGVDPGYGLLDEADAVALAEIACRRAVRAALAEGDDDVRALVRALGYGTTIAQAARTLRWLGERGVPAAALLENARLLEPGAAATAEAEATEAAARLAEALTPLRAFDAGFVNPANRAALDAVAAAGGDLDRAGEAGDPAAVAGAAVAAATALKGVRQRKGGLPDLKKAAVAAAEEARAAATGLFALPGARRIARGLEAVVGRADRDYADAKAARDALDFRDLLIGARDLLAGHEAVRRAVRDRYDVVLVDEFQDTDPVQAEIVHLLRADDDGETLRPAGLFLVGDRKQSIYGFRGADVRVFEAFTDEVVAGGGRRLALRTSYRSTATLLGAVNRLARLALEGDGDAATGYHDDDDLLPDPGTEGGDGDVAVELLDGGDRTQPGPPVREARMVARRIVELCRGGTGAGEVAILLPTFTHLSTWTEELVRAGLPFHVVKGRGFYDAQEVRDLARALALVIDRDDSVALAAVLRSPMVALSDPALATLAEAGRLDGRWLVPGASLPEALGADDAESLARFARLYQALATHGDRVGPTRTLEALLRETGYRALLAALPDGAQKVANVDKVVSLARAREAAGRGDLQAFARDLVLRIDDAKAGREQTAAVVEETGGDAVRVLTVHQAKGLEFEVVALGGLARPRRPDGAPVRLDPDLGPCLKAPGPDGTLVPAGDFEAAGARGAARAAAERARLFYVALTRARRRLLLTGEAARLDGPCERRLVDDAIDGGARIGRRAYETLPAPPVPGDPPARVGALDPRAAEAAVARVRPLTRLPVRRVFVPVTALQTFAECPRRYRAAFLLGLEEHPRPAVFQDDPVADAERPGPTGDPRRAGSMVHAVLEHADPAAFRREGRSHLEAVGARLGLDRSRHRDLVDAAARFLDSGYGRGLETLGPEAVGRELPFVLAATDGAGLTVHVKGQIDLLVHRADQVEVVDYKLTRPGPRGPEAYRFQLECYGAAAGDRAGGLPVRLGIQFLEGQGDGPRWLPDPADPDEVADRVAGLGRALLESRAAGRFDGRPRSTCEALGCGYLGLCHGPSQEG